MAAACHLEAQQTNPGTTLFKARQEAYWQHEPQDVCTKMLTKVAAREIRLNSTSQQALTSSLLKTLAVPESSQLLVFSGTASQGRKVRPENPRALYFNDEVYVGVVPSGFVEVVGIDPEFGAVLYSFESVKAGAVPVPTRSRDCMRCHATGASGGMPGMIARSVTPFTTVGNHASENHLIAGHQVPLDVRFGGWHVTSTKPFGQTKEGMVAEKLSSGVRLRHIKTGELFDLSKYLTRSSDILAHLVHEHQMGFVNRVVNVRTAARESGFGKDKLTTVTDSRLNAVERELVRYVLFADEADLPSGGIVGDPRYMKDFGYNRKPTRAGASLKDLDLNTRMFKYRCSYMIYTAQWQEMPPALKSRIYARMKAAISSKDSEFAYLTADERTGIITILRETLPDLPEDWR